MLYMVVAQDVLVLIIIRDYQRPLCHTLVGMQRRVGIRLRDWVRQILQSCWSWFKVVMQRREEMERGGRGEEGRERGPVNGTEADQNGMLT